MKKVLLIVLGFLFFTTTAYAAYPQPVGYVNDYTGKLSKEFIAKEEQKLSEYQKRTTNEIAVVVIDTTGEQEIEQYSIGLADQWKPGEKGKDNGIIILLAMNDRRMRIEVGRGLEGDLTDVESGQILGDMITPLRAGDTEGAVDTGVNEVIDAISSSVTEVPVEQVASQEKNNGDAWVFLLIVGIIIVGMFIAAYFSGKQVDQFGSSDWGDYDEKEDDDDDSSSTVAGAALGGVTGYGLGKATSEAKEEEDDEPVTKTKTDDDDDDDSGSGFNPPPSSPFKGFGGGSFAGGGASREW